MPVEVDAPAESSDAAKVDRLDQLLDEAVETNRDTMYHKTTTPSEPDEPDQ